MRKVAEVRLGTRVKGCDWVEFVKATLLIGCEMQLRMTPSHGSYNIRTPWDKLED
jgi:hypothetical protein